MKKGRERGGASGRKEERERENERVIGEERERDFHNFNF